MYYLTPYFCHVDEGNIPPETNHRNSHHPITPPLPSFFMLTKETSHQKLTTETHTIPSHHHPHHIVMLTKETSHQKITPKTPTILPHHFVMLTKETSHLKLTTETHTGTPIILECCLRKHPTNKSSINKVSFVIFMKETSHQKLKNNFI